MHFVEIVVGYNAHGGGEVQTANLPPDRHPGSGDTLLISLFGTGFLAFKLPAQQEFQFLNKRVFTQRPTGATGQEVKSAFDR